MTSTSATVQASSVLRPAFTKASTQNFTRFSGKIRFAIPKRFLLFSPDVFQSELRRRLFAKIRHQRHQRGSAAIQHERLADDEARFLTAEKRRQPRNIEWHTVACSRYGIVGIFLGLLFGEPRDDLVIVFDRDPPWRNSVYAYTAMGKFDTQRSGISDDGSLGSCVGGVFRRSLQAVDG